MAPELLADPEYEGLVEAAGREVLVGLQSADEIAVEFLLDEGDLTPGPDWWEERMARLDRAGQEHLAKRFMRAVWNDLADKAGAWEGTTTGLDRLRAAFDQLREQNILVEEFTDWSAVEGEERHAGALHTSVFDVDRLELGPVQILMEFRSLTGDAQAVGRAAVDALTAQGLSPRWDGSEFIEVEVEWLPHLQHVAPEPS